MGSISGRFVGKCGLAVIGLTGGIASGKSKVSDYLARLGAEIIDADLVSRELVQPGSPLLEEIAGAFGPAVLRPDGTLDRPALAGIIFSDPAKRRLLDSLTQPPIMEEIRQRVSVIRDAHGQRPALRVAVVVAPLLIEAGGCTLVDQVWVIKADENTRLRRLEGRDKIPRDEALRRIRAQMPDDERIRYADEVIENSGPWPQTESRLFQLWERILFDLAHCAP